MKQEKILNKSGEVMTTKEGVELLKNTLEEGDQFIPIHNNIMEKKRTVEIKGEEKVITDYKMIAKVMRDSVDYLNGKGENEHFITLTPSQAKAIKKKVTAGIEINQNVFNCYEYVNDYGKQVGVGIKQNEQPAIEF